MQQVVKAVDEQGQHKLLENSLNNLSRTELYFTGYTFGIWVSLCHAAGPVCMEIF